jgi:hypothetical protein
VIPPQAAALWDDEYLYVGFWIEEPFVRARLTERDALSRAPYSDQCAEDAHSWADCRPVQWRLPTARPQCLVWRSRTDAQRIAYR